MFVVNENFDRLANEQKLPLTDTGGGGAGNGIAPSIGVTPVDGSGDMPTDGLEPVDPIPQDVQGAKSVSNEDGDKRKKWFWIFLGLIALAIIIFFVIKKTGTNGLPK